MVLLHSPNRLSLNGQVRADYAVRKKNPYCHITSKSQPWFQRTANQKSFFLRKKSFQILLELEVLAGDPDIVLCTLDWTLTAGLD